MTKRLLGTLTALLCVWIFSAGGASAMPTGYFGFNDTRIDIPSGDWIRLPDGNWGVQFHYFDSNYAISGSARIVGDPSIVYGLSVQNYTGSVATFSLGFSTSFPTLTRASMVVGSWSGSVTDAGGDGLTLAPVLPDLDGDGILELQSSTLGVPLTNMGVDVGQGLVVPPGVPGGSYEMGQFYDGPKDSPHGSWTTMTSLLEFSLTGQGDVATVNGATQVEAAQPVPEPATALLLAPAVLGLAAWRMRKRS